MIPGCTLKPCLHDGICHDVDIINFRCDCSNTHYIGHICNTGIIETPDIPVLTIGEVSDFLNISAYPDTELIVEVEASDGLLVIPSTLYLYQEYPYSSFILHANNEGIYSLSYNISGVDEDKFQVPSPIRVLAIDPTIEYEVNKYFNETDQPIGILSPGCCTPGGLVYQCPYSTNIVTFTSTCSWLAEGVDDHVSDGVVFASTSHGFSLPVSVSGSKLVGILGDQISNMLPDSNIDCNDCSMGDESCNFYNFTVYDIFDILAAKSLGVTYLNLSDDLLPLWLSLLVNTDDSDNGFDRTFSINDFTTILSSGSDVDMIEGCEGLEVDPDGLYSVLRFQDSLIARVNDIERNYAPRDEDETLCIAINLCTDGISPVHFTIPSGSQETIRNFSEIQVRIMYLLIHTAVMTHQQDMLEEEQIITCILNG